MDAHLPHRSLLVLVYMYMYMYMYMYLKPIAVGAYMYILRICMDGAEA